MASGHKFIRVSRKHKCPVCGKPDWCSVTSDGVYVRCMRIESGWAVTGSDGVTGYMHLLDGNIELPPPSPERKKLTSSEVTELAANMFRDGAAPATRKRLSEELGVTERSLSALGVGLGRDWDGREFASFPSRDEGNRVIGITRRYSDGSKKTYPGTRNGLFYSKASVKLEGPVFVPEGGSDTAAFLSVGLCAIGRPSNVGGVRELKALLKNTQRRVVVVAERDYKKGVCPESCRGCQCCYPGVHGARTVANALGAQWCMPPVGFKDFREAVASGWRPWVSLWRGW